MISTKNVILTVVGSLGLVVVLAAWYSYEPAPATTTTPSELNDIEPEAHELNTDTDNDTETDTILDAAEEVATDKEITTNDTHNQDSMIDTTNPIATFNTNLGTIRLELFQSDMPITVENFVSLANDGFYDGIKFHRVIPGFMIQGGDPNTREDDTSRYGQGGPGYTIQDEFVEGDHLRNLPGTIAMANTGQPNSGGSQFFINVADNRNLDFDTPPMQSRHPVFGQVIEGMDVVQQIENVPTGARDIPEDPVIIESVTITTN